MEELENLLQAVEQQGHIDKLERAILQVASEPGKKGQVYCDTICHVNKDTGYMYRDFGSVYRNVLALCLKDWRTTCASSYQSPPDSVVMGLLAVKAAAEHPDMITASEVPNVVSEWQETMLKNELVPLANNEQLVMVWMKKARFERAVRDSHYKMASGSGRLSASKIVERMQRSLSLTDLEGQNTSSDFVSINDILKPKTGDAIKTTFYSTGVPIVDRMLGGGYIRGYSYLNITGSGGGKTVFATTNAVNLSLRQDLKGLWVSTEEPENEVYYRVLSNFCNVPHEDIRKKLPTGELVLPPPAKAKFDMAVKKMQENLLVKRWIAEDYNIEIDLAAEVQSFKERMGCMPHYIIFDWLGASMAELTSSNGLRNSLKAKAFAMDKVAKRSNITVLFSMQVGEQYKAERYINQSHVDECKGAAMKCAAVLGWSFMPNKGDGTSLASNGVHSDLQFFSIGKSRFGTGGFFQVKRNFAVQSFIWPK